jgi:UDPglucose 6-dehydrogenase
MQEAKRVLALDFNDAPDALDRIRYSESPMDALKGADALAIVTEWKIFRSPDFDQIKSLLKSPVIFDGRNLFEPEIMGELGIEYHGIGRSVLTRA